MKAGQAKAIAHVQSLRRMGGPRQDVPEVLFSKNPVQAVGRVISRSVWPVGAVSNTSRS